ncbi:hypothetical protein O6H91_Y378300 [Diphasiastrum complanatum]|nr:hypothetical protein O6H91_Y378300 [Diphasiastrum complanatum]KAJ7279231.1 hypothetical protein O6H91_Y378300 [Diphasiastrum complanatum]
MFQYIGVNDWHSPIFKRGKGLWAFRTLCNQSLSKNNPNNYIQRFDSTRSQKSDSKEEDSSSSKSKNICHSDADGDFLLMTLKQSKSHSKEEDDSSSEVKRISHSFADGDLLLMTSRQSQKKDSKEEDDSSNKSKKISYSFADGDLLLMTSKESQKSDLKEVDGSSSLTPEDQLVLLKSAYELADVNRRSAQRQFLDLYGNIQIFCMVRRVGMEGNTSQLEPVIRLETREVEVEIPKAGKENRAYKFDKVFPPTSSQDEVFDEIEPVVQSAMDGQNICVLAYGQEEAQKTFSMTGSRDCPGIIARTLQLLFDKASMDCVGKYSFGLSIVQLYKGLMHDLLASHPTQTKKVSCLKIKMAGPRIEVENLNEVILKSDKHGILLFEKAIRAGSASSHIATRFTSHRSHCLVRVTVTRILDSGDGDRTTSQLWLVNLGSSERMLETQETQVYENFLQESRYINVSLVALGDVLSTLQKKQSHVPYRNNKLTQLLRDCLGSNSTALILVHISPKEEDIRETISTLEFSLRVGKYHNEQFSPVTSPEREAEKVTALRKTKDCEIECQWLSNKLRDLELLMKENSENHPGAEHQLQNTKTKGNSPDTETLYKIKSLKHASMTSSISNFPRFMEPTVSSRGKQIVSE